ncbi:telomere-binding alpha subunit central domain protein [Talaromyces stipitatus ATCC 10500]|uniref:Protection of telomeres protein 1 n=1 Tax=Talaromyces stipitatus (strain ATCC 10500 / CBS 375.48 / QM 6759 / NRRL 1006) TaxID=441959 RepID=B8MQ03_TALSN|nr:telomere-binding alpha subunit central domain protein [Talaromyces stipitatus ATCC 10500]EED12893.1 telomere-binding alpha subunit central domain protein [Talaromyces stipitatus ATCC 10500]
MPASFPPRFVSVDTAKRSQGYHNLIGVVVDCLPKSRSQGSSYVTTFTIKDSDLGPGNQAWKGLKIKYFNDDEHRLPDVKVNDVILLRRLRVRPFHGPLHGVVGNTDNVSWAIFRQPDGPESLGMPVCSPGSKALTVEEQTYAHTLLEAAIYSRSTVSATPSSRRKGHAESSSTPSESVRQATAKPKKKDRFSLVKDLSVNTFADLAVHVVKMWYQDDRVHLYVTDYTVNKSLFDYGDKSDEDEGAADDGLGFLTRPTREKRAWQGPKGRMTLQVTLWDPHSYYARENVHEDGYILLRNVHVKADKMNGLLEGVMHTDHKYPEKVDVRVLEDNQQDDPRIVELKTRKREYWKQNRTNKRELAEDFGDGDEGGSKKNAKKRRKDQQRQKRQQEQRKQQNKPPQREEGQTEIPGTVNKSNRPNPHIQAKDPARGCRKLSEILLNDSHDISLPDNIQYRLPFQCVKYRTTVRVVDFFPPNIADFAVPYIPKSSSSSSSDDEDDITSETPGIRWEWRFCLLVEDAQILPGQPRDRVKLFVSGSDAEFLLKLDAVNLRKNKETFIRLQEKLCILWGDLEERKSSGMDTQQKGPSQLPFTCCVKEWGVRCACRTNASSQDDSDRECAVVGPEHNRECLGWERRFALFGTTINEE